MALARFEGIADYLNEAKRQVEQRSIVEHLNNKVTGLPFKLVDSKRWLHRQDVVTRLVRLPLFGNSRECALFADSACLHFYGLFCYVLSGFAFLLCTELCESVINTGYGHANFGMYMYKVCC